MFPGYNCFQHHQSKHWRFHFPTNWHPLTKHQECSITHTYIQIEVQHYHRTPCWLCTDQQVLDGRVWQLQLWSRLQVITATEQHLDPTENSRSTDFTELRSTQVTRIVVSRSLQRKEKRQSTARKVRYSKEDIPVIFLLAMFANNKFAIGH